MSEGTDAQLAALDRVGRSLEATGIDHWLFGGWAVDFHAGAVTRPHDDLDLAVWLDDLPRIAEVLERDGWEHAPAADEDGGTGYERDGVRLELTYLVRGDNAGVRTPLRSGEAPWPAGAFADDTRRLRGARARVISLGALADGKASPRDDPGDAAKDRADQRTLGRLADRDR